MVWSHGWAVAAAAALGIAAPSALAAEHRVANVEELAAAVRVAQPGDAVVLGDGVWRDADIVFEAQGTADRPITMRAATPGRTILTGRSRLRIAGQHLVVEGLWFKDGYPAGDDAIAFRRSSTQHAHHCRVTNCAITGYNPPDRRQETKWISLYGTHNRVDHCYLAGKENGGTTVVVWLPETPPAPASLPQPGSPAPAFNHQIDHNHFGARPALGANGGETLRVGDSKTSMQDARTLVEHNLFEECNGEAEIVSNKSCANVYRYNTFLRCQGALTLRHGNRCTVEGNFFLGDGQPRTGGVRIIGEDHRVYNNYFANLTGEGIRAAVCLMNGIPNSPLNAYFQVQRATIAYNTLVNCRENFVLGLVSDNPKGATLPPQDGTIANNLVVGQQGPLVREITPPINLRWEANLLYGAALGLPPTPGIRQVDPRLHRAADNLFRPAGDSPALGAASANFPFVADDFEGHPRGAKPDIGCDQTSHDPPHRRPLTASDVGPAWRDAL